MYGNTPLHYAKPYPDQSIVLYLLSHGAKLDVNNRKVVNLNENTLEKYFFESCVKVEGDYVDTAEKKLRTPDADDEVKTIDVRDGMDEPDH